MEIFGVPFINCMAYIACYIILFLHVRYHLSVGTPFFLGLITSVVGLLLTPPLFFVSGLFMVYKYFVAMRLSKEEGFMGIMAGSDAYWANEENHALSVINVVLTADFTKLRQQGKEPLEAMRELGDRVVNGEATCKFKCKRKLSSYGYYYLQKCDFRAEQNVRHMEHTIDTMSDYKSFVSKVSNEPLANDGFWEILVGSKPLTGTSSTPVLLRFHHALGDGYALVHLFLEFMADKDPINAKLVKKNSVKKRIIDMFTSVIETAIFYVYGALVIIEQLIKSPDRNSLHNKKGFTGKKVYRWLEIDLNKIKEIRKTVGCRFTDVQFTILSDSLENCFDSWGENVDKISLVLTIRPPSSDFYLGKLTNAFSVVMMDLPLKGRGKLRAIRKESEQLRRRPHIYVNYWLFGTGYTIFPVALIGAILKSRTSSVAFSNVPGPRVRSKLVGCDVTQITPFLPHRDTTGVSIAMFSYVDKMSVGISADSSLLTSEEQVDQLLEGISESAEKMYATYVLNAVK